MKKEEIMEILESFDMYLRKAYGEIRFNYDDAAKFASQFQQEDKISDEDIKKWAEKNQVLYEDERLQKIDISGRIEGAKAMRDGQIKTNK